MDAKVKRGIAVPVPDWWLAAINRARAGITNGKLAEAAEKALGRHVDNTQVSRCIGLNPDKRIATTDLIDFFSDLLDVPRPIWRAISEDEARRFKTQRKLTALDDRTGATAETFGDLSNFSRSATIQSGDGEKEAAPGVSGRVAAGRRKASSR